MHLLIVGSRAPGALETYCAAGLEQLGHTVTFHDRHARLDGRARFRATPLLSEIEYALLKPGFNRTLIKQVKATRPDVVFVFKGVELAPRTLEAIRSLPDRPLLINWNPDSPFDYGTTNTNPDLIASIPLYDVYAIWNRDLFRPLIDAGSKHLIYLPFGFDPAVHHPVEGGYTVDVCFVGGYTPDRALALTHIALSGIDLGIWGTNWHLLPAESPLHDHLRGGWTAEEAMSAVFSQARIVLNFIREQNGQAHNMRTFEAPATRSLMLATRTRDQMRWLPEDIGAAYFASPESMVERIRHYLAHPDRLEEVADHAYETLHTRGHTYLHRMQRLMDVIDSL